MTTPPIPALPMAMIVAARDVLLAHRGEVWASSITGVVHSWSCSCGEAGPVDNREEGDRLAANHIAAVTLAAAFSVCEIEVQRSIQGEDDEGPWTVYVNAVDWPLDQEDGKRHTRLRIRTPWTPAEQVDTEGAGRG